MAGSLSQKEERNRTDGMAQLDSPDGLVRTLDRAQMSQADRALAANGYKPVFRREFGFLSTFSFAVSIGGLFSTIATTLIYPLQAGGSASAVWCTYPPSRDVCQLDPPILMMVLKYQAG
jgi:hypothetical protein